MILSKEHELMRKNFRNFAETEFYNRNSGAVRQRRWI